MRSPSVHPLTHNERQAAEAAFAGAPCHQRGTARAQAIYRSLWIAKYGRGQEKGGRESILDIGAHSGSVVPA